MTATLAVRYDPDHPRRTRRYGNHLRYLGRDGAQRSGAVAAIGLTSMSPSRLGLLLVGTLVVILGHGLAFATVTNALGINAPIPHHGVASLSRR